MRLARARGRQPPIRCAANGTSLKRQQGNLGLGLGDRQQQIAEGFESPVSGRLQPARNLFRSVTDSSGNLGTRQTTVRFFLEKFLQDQVVQPVTESLLESGERSKRNSVTVEESRK